MAYRGGNHSFPALSDLLLTNDVAQVSKLTLPESWADPAAFPQLVTLGIGNCSINGMCPAVKKLPYLAVVAAGPVLLGAGISAACAHLSMPYASVHGLSLFAFGAHARMLHCKHIAAGCMLKCSCTTALPCFLCVTATSLGVSLVVLGGLRAPMS